MPQQLQVFQHPEIVANHPVSALEKLQYATEAEAARRRDALSEVGGSPISSLYDVSYDPSAPISPGFRPGTWAFGGRDAVQAIEAAAPNGPGYQSGYVKAYNDRLPSEPAYRAPTRDLASLFGDMIGRSSAGMTGPNTMPVDSDVPLNLGGAKVVVRVPTIHAPPAARPKPAPAPVVESSGHSFSSSDAHAGSPIAQMFAPNTQLPAGMNNRRWAGDGY